MNSIPDRSESIASHSTAPRAARASPGHLACVYPGHLARRDPCQPSTSRESAAIVRLPAQDLATILNEVRSLRNDFDRFRKTHGEFAVRTTNEIDELFAKVETKTVCPGKKQEARLNRLEALLIARANEPLTFSEIGKYLELGSRCGKVTTRRQNMTLLGKILEAEGKRFHVFESNIQKGAEMVCLATDYFTRVREGVKLYYNGSAEGHEFPIL
jgi:hypothetical protein